MSLRRLLKTMAWGCLALLMGVPLALGLRAWWAVPAMAGSAQVHGLAGPVEIVRDVHAIPHVFAGEASDAYFALGYAHAQDRLWQMELSRRAGAGTLAEILGERGLETDKLFRTLDLESAARASQDTLDAQTRQALKAYTAGINAWLSAVHPLPLEFVLLGCAPQAWRELDSLLVLKLMAWQLSGNWGDELRRLRLRARLDGTKLSQLVQPNALGSSVSFESMWHLYQDTGLALASPEPLPAPHTQHVPRASKAARSLAVRLEDVARDLARFAPTQLGRAIGSNNWALHGSRTSSGKPLLANDPHLELTAPSQWYFAHLSAPGLDVIGATIPGIPGVIVGRNADVAWAFTNMGSDTEDLYFEKLAGPTRYATPTGSAPFIEKHERIRVRGASPVTLRTRRTRHGPVISDVSKEAHELTGSQLVLALRWVGLLDGDTTLSFPVHAAHAANAEELRAATRYFHAPAQNIVFADRFGSIGFVAAGKLPLRSSASVLRGLVPAPGWIVDHDWTGFVPFDELPQQRDPAAGSIVTANQNTLPPDYPHWIGADFGPSYRADRIKELLAQTPSHDLSSVARVQSDLQSALAQAALPGMLARLGSEHAADQSLLDELRAWNYEMRADSRPALLFSAWLREFSRRVCADELGEQFLLEWETSAELVVRMLQRDASEELSAWCDDITTAQLESCDEMLTAGLDDALAYLRGRFGADADAWTWGRAHRSVLFHKLLGELPLAEAAFNVTLPRGGDGTTVDVGAYTWDDDEFAFENTWGPGFRAIYDLSKPEHSLGILNTGQSGHVMSSHYRDMAQLWARGEFVSLTTNVADIRARSLGTIVLTPR